MSKIYPTVDQIQKDLDSPFLDPYTRAANVAFPFLYLYQPTAAVLSFGLGIRKVWHLASGKQKDPLAAVETLCQLGLSYASPVGGAILASGTLLGKQVYHMGDHLSKQEWSQFGSEFLGAMITTVHLFAIFSGSPASIAASIVLRSLSECQESYSSYKEGNWPEALGSLALAVIHAYSARPYISKSWSQYFSRSLMSEDALQSVGQSGSLSLQMTNAQTGKAKVFPYEFANHQVDKAKIRDAIYSFILYVGTHPNAQVRASIGDKDLLTLLYFWVNPDNPKALEAYQKILQLWASLPKGDRFMLSAV